MNHTESFSRKVLSCGVRVATNVFITDMYDSDGYGSPERRHSEKQKASSIEADAYRWLFVEVFLTPEQACVAGRRKDLYGMW